MYLLSRPYLPVIRDGVVYAIRARTHAPINSAQIARSLPHRMSQLPRRTARGTGDLGRTPPTLDTFDVVGVGAFLAGPDALGS
jgi:hypothetical protein